MEDDDNKSKPKKDDPLSSQVLEYYKSFSQSRQLPKYFSGTETNNVTPDKPKVHTCILQTSPTCITSIEQTKINPKSVNVPIPVVVVQEVKDNVSPSSSITSPKKLEWDSGADIGYENYQKHKFVQRSVSLPILTNLDQVKLAKSYLRITPDIESNLSKEDSKKIVPSKYTSSSSSSGELDNKHSNIISSSSSSEPKEKSPITTTSSSDPREVPISSTTTSTESENYRQNLPKKNLLDFVKKHVGYPVAESTPLQIERKYTSKLKIDVQGENSKNMPNKSTKSTQFEQETPINKKVKKSSQHKKKLMKTTPITIDCVNYQKLCDKLVQTSFPRNLSISVQTDPVFSQQEQVAVPEQKSMSIGQKVIYLTHSNSEKDSYISSCNSFEYLSGEQHGSLRNRVLTHLNSLSNSGSDKGNDEFEIQPTLKDNKPKNIQCDSPQSNITESDKNSILSNTSPVLGELIANQQSSLLISDIEHSISLLQKLVKSKKYDKQTKKYYIKKIVDKILNCKYADDSLSDRNNTENSSTKNVHSPLSEAHEENIEENYIDKNIGWTSPSSNEAQPNNLNGNFKIETFTSEFMPCESGDIQERKVIPALRQTKSEKPIGSENNTNKRSQFTLTKGSQKIQQSTSERNTVATANKQSSGIPSENFIVSSNNNSPEVSSAKSTYDNSYKTSARSWKDDKTISEKLYEQGNLDKIIGDHENNSDVLLNFAKKERETQINWINNEITHLSKLKKLLEQKNGDKTDKVQKVIDNILYAPELDSLKDVKKSTAVYVITTERGEKIDSSSTDRSNATKDKVNFHLYNALNKEHGYQFKETVAKTSKEQDKIVKSQVYVDIKKGGSANIKLNAKKIPMDGAMGEPPNRSSPDSNDDIPKVPALNLRPRKLEPKPIKDPKLITSQSYCIRENPQTCIRRYVFEIPINEENCDCESHIQGSKLHSITKPEKPCKKDSGKGETNASRKTSADSWNRRVMLVVAEKQGSEEKVSVSEIFEQNIVPMSLTQPFSEPSNKLKRIKPNDLWVHTISDTSIHLSKNNKGKEPLLQITSSSSLIVKKEKYAHPCCKYNCGPYCETKLCMPRNKSSQSPCKQNKETTIKLDNYRRDNCCLTDVIELKSMGTKIEEDLSLCACKGTETNPRIIKAINTEKRKKLSSFAETDEVSCSTKCCGNKYVSFDKGTQKIYKNNKSMNVDKSCCSTCDKAFATDIIETCCEATGNDYSSCLKDVSTDGILYSSRGNDTYPRVCKVDQFCGTDLIKSRCKYTGPEKIVKTNKKTGVQKDFFKCGQSMTDNYLNDVSVCTNILDFSSQATGFDVKEQCNKCSYAKTNKRHVGILTNKNLQNKNEWTKPVPVCTMGTIIEDEREAKGTNPERNVSLSTTAVVSMCNAASNTEFRNINTICVQNDQIKEHKGIMCTYDRRSQGVCAGSCKQAATQASRDIKHYNTQTNRNKTSNQVSTNKKNKSNKDKSLFDTIMDKVEKKGKKKQKDDNESWIRELSNSIFDVSVDKSESQMLLNKEICKCDKNCQFNGKYVSMASSDKPRANNKTTNRKQDKNTESLYNNRKYNEVRQISSSIIDQNIQTETKKKSVCCPCIENKKKENEQKFVPDEKKIHKLDSSSSLIDSVDQKIGKKNRVSISNSIQESADSTSTLNLAMIEYSDSGGSIKPKKGIMNPYHKNYGLVKHNPSSTSNIIYQDMSESFSKSELTFEDGYKRAKHMKHTKDHLPKKHGLVRQSSSNLFDTSFQDIYHSPVSASDVTLDAYKRAKHNKHAKHNLPRKHGLVKTYSSNIFDESFQDINQLPVSTSDVTLDVYKRAKHKKHTKHDLPKKHGLVKTYSSNVFDASFQDINQLPVSTSDVTLDAYKRAKHKKHTKHHLPKKHGLVKTYSGNVFDASFQNIDQLPVSTSDVTLDAYKRAKHKKHTKHDLPKKHGLVKTYSGNVFDASFQNINQLPVSTSDVTLDAYKRAKHKRHTKHNLPKKYGMVRNVSSSFFDTNFQHIEKLPVFPSQDYYQRAKNQKYMKPDFNQNEYGGRDNFVSYTNDKNDARYKQNIKDRYNKEENNRDNNYDWIKSISESFIDLNTNTKNKNDGYDKNRMKEWISLMPSSNSRERDKQKFKDREDKNRGERKKDDYNWIRDISSSLIDLSTQGRNRQKFKDRDDKSRGRRKIDDDYNWIRDISSSLIDMSTQGRNKQKIKYRDDKSRGRRKRDDDYNWIRDISSSLIDMSTQGRNKQKFKYRDDKSRGRRKRDDDYNWIRDISSSLIDLSMQGRNKQKFKDRYDKSRGGKKRDDDYNWIRDISSSLIDLSTRDKYEDARSRERNKRTDDYHSTEPTSSSKSKYKSRGWNKRDDYYKTSHSMTDITHDKSRNKYCNEMTCDKFGRSHRQKRLDHKKLLKMQNLLRNNFDSRLVLVTLDNVSSSKNICDCKSQAERFCNNSNKRNCLCKSRSKSSPIICKEPSYKNCYCDLNKERVTCLCKPKARRDKSITCKKPRVVNCTRQHSNRRCICTNSTDISSSQLICNESSYRNCYCDVDEERITCLCKTKVKKDKCITCNKPRIENCSRLKNLESKRCLCKKSTDITCLYRLKGGNDKSINADICYYKKDVTCSCKFNTTHDEEIMCVIPETRNIMCAISRKEEYCQSNEPNETMCPFKSKPKECECDSNLRHKRNEQGCFCNKIEECPYKSKQPKTLYAEESCQCSEPEINICRCKDKIVCCMCKNNKRYSKTSKDESTFYEGPKTCNDYKNTQTYCPRKDNYTQHRKNVTYDSTCKKDSYDKSYCRKDLVCMCEPPRKQNENFYSNECYSPNNGKIIICDERKNPSYQSRENKSCRRTTLCMSNDKSVFNIYLGDNYMDKTNDNVDEMSYDNYSEDSYYEDRDSRDDQPWRDTDSQNVDEDGTPWRNESVNSIGEEEGFLGKHDLRYRDGDDDDATKDERRTRRGGRKDEIYPDDSARTDYEGVRMEREDERFIQESEIQEYDGNYPTDDRRQIDRDGRRSPHDALDDRRRVDRGGRRDQRYDDEQDLPSIDGRQNRDYPSSDRRRTGRDYPSTDGRQDFDDRDYTSSDRRGTDRDFPSSDGRKDFDDREYPSTNTRRTDRDFPSSDRRNADKGGRKGDHSYEDRQDDRGGRRDQKYANEDTDNRRSQQPDRSRGSYQRGSADQKRYKNGKYPVPKRLVKHGRMTSVREEEENRKHIKKQIGGGPNRSYVEKLDNRGKTRRGSGSPQGRIRPVTKVDVVNKRQSKDGRDFDGKVRGKYRDRSPDNKIKFGSGRRGQPTAKGERHSDGGRKYNTSPQDGAPKSPGSPKKSSLSKTDDKQGRKYSASKGDKTRDSSSEYGVEEEEQKSKSDSSKSEDKTTSTSVENKRGMQTKTAQTENKQDTSSSSSSSSSSSTSSTSSSSYEICRCCRRRELVQPEISIPNSTLNSFERNYFCPPCNNYYGNRGICYRPGTACNCYSMIRNDHINDIKQTVNQLQQLYQEDLQCICSKGKKPCTCRRKPKRKKKGIAYMLTLEETTEGEATKKSPKKNLEEFTIKIPVPKHKHKSKDKDKEKHSHKSKKHDKKNEKKHKKHHRSLQDYLFSNRPDFVQSAEERRKCMLELAYMREERNDKFKQLLALTKGESIPSNNDKPKRMFSPNEMKRMTANKYKKLPEVQQKQLDNKKKQIKTANRLLADIFNKRLQNQVLKGNTDLPVDASVIKLY